MAIRSTRLRLLAFSILSGTIALGCGGGLDTSDFPVDDDTGGGDDGGADGAGDGVGLDGSDGTATDSDGTDVGSDTTVADTTIDDTTGTDGAGGDTTGSDTTVADSGIDSAPIDSGVDAVDSADAGCPAPVVGTIFVSPTGSDTTGNGSAACPYVTITKALSGTPSAVGPTTISVASGSAATPNVYGVGCTAGAGKCDATPIRVTDGMNKGIVIQGSSVDPTALTVVGGVAAADVAVFVVTAPNVGFANLTVTPKKLATSSGPGSRTVGSHGIRFAAPAVASGAEAKVTNVRVIGVAFSASSESTGSGIEIGNGTSPTIGPGVTIVGGDHSVNVTQASSGAPSSASKPTITSSAAAPSFFHSTQFACVRVESANAAATVLPTATLTSVSTADPGRLHLQDCGGNGGVVVDTVKGGTAVNVTNTLIDTSAATVPAYYGIRIVSSGRLVASSAVTITGINELSPGVGAGIEASGTSAFGVSPGLGGPGLVVTKNLGSGVRLTGNAVADISTLTSTQNRRTGFLCDATPPGPSGINVFLRNSTFTGNSQMGAFIVGRASGSCVADLGNAASGGKNVYNTTAAKNGAVGLCYTSLVAGSATSSTWGCGLSAATACTPATATVPAPIAVVACDSVGDYNTSATLTVALPQTCCGF